MKQSERRHVSGLAYSAIVILGLTVAACEEKPSAGNAAPPVASQAAQPVTPKVEPPKPADAVAPASPQTEDAALAEKIKSTLEADPALKASSFDVAVSGGVATLFGTADTRAHRDKAAQIAATVPGVKSVKNEMVILAGS